MITRASSILILAGILVVSVPEFVAGQDPTPSPTPDDAQQQWKNTAGNTDFNAGTSWVSGTAPGNNDVGAFTSAPVAQPNLSASVQIAGLYFKGTGTSGYDLTRSGITQTLTLTATATSIGNETNNGQAVAIGAENTSGTNTIDVPIILAPGTGTVSTIFQAAGGTLVINGVISGSTSTFGLSKTGGGTLVLSGTNTYTGATTVSAGTLFVNGSLASGSAVTVSNSGTVLGGTGTINGSVTVNSGAILEGGTGSTGQTLTLKGAVTMSTGSVIQLALGPSLTHSTIAISSPGTLSFATNQDFRFIDLGATTGTYLGLITGVPNPGTALNSWVIDNAGFTGTFSWDSTNGGEIDLTLTKVPEPGTWGAAALAFGLVGYLQRRRFSRLLKRA